MYPSVRSHNRHQSSLQPDTLQVLLVDDKEDHFIMTRRLFSSMRRGEYKLEWIATFDKAFEAISQARHDVYLIDHRLGVKNGLDLIKKAREMGIRAPMILFTTGEDPNADLEALKLGATDYLAKGRVDALLLERTIHYAIQHTRQLDALRESEERLRIAIDAAQIGTVEWDMLSNNITFGGHLDQVMGIDLENTPPTSDGNDPPNTFEGLLEYVHPEDREAVQQAVYEAAGAEGSRFEIEFRVVYEGIPHIKWLAAQGEVFCDRSGKPIRASGVMQDITDRKLIEQQRILLLEREQEARRLLEEANEMKLRFLAMVSHELRTPLTSIKGFTSTLLADDVEWSLDQYVEYVGIIDHETDKLTDLVAQLMDVSRLHAGVLPIQLEPHHLSSIVQSALPQLEAATQTHHIDINIPDDLPPVQSDRRRIEQVIVNLVENAAKYSEPATQIWVSARLVSSSDHPFVEVCVEDQGVGIPLEERERVFEAFQQLGPAHKGAGLGLAICKGLIEAQGGSIWIGDKPSPGTRITFTLMTA